MLPKLLRQCITESYIVSDCRDSKADEQPQQGVDVVPPDQWQLYPTSVEWQPAFSMMVPLKGAGDPQAGDDVAATITAWGTWQPGLEPHRSPSPSEVLVAALGGARADQQVRRHGCVPAELTPQMPPGIDRSCLTHWGLESNGSRILAGTCGGAEII